MDRRISPPKGPAFEALLDRLTSALPGGRDERLFETRQKALMFAAGLGFARGKRSALAARDAAGAIRFDIFENARDDVFVSALGILESGGDLNVLADSRQGELVTAFEEYAHSGLLELERVCFGGVRDPLEALVALVCSLGVSSEHRDEFPDVDADVLKDLMDE